jgi:dipeptidyl aminopeptidase/acylaminoacyl peptidase
LQQWGSYQELRYVFNAYLANSGYVVMDLDYRGSSGYGRNWRTCVYLHMGGPDLQDVLGAVDYLRARGGVDLSQGLGVWGVSYGGFMTNMALFLSRHLSPAAPGPPSTTGRTTIPATPSSGSRRPPPTPKPTAAAPPSPSPATCATTCKSSMAW